MIDFIHTLLPICDQTYSNAVYHQSITTLYARMLTYLASLLFGNRQALMTFIWYLPVIK